MFCEHSLRSGSSALGIQTGWHVRRVLKTTGVSQARRKMSFSESFWEIAGLLHDWKQDGWWGLVGDEVLMGRSGPGGSGNHR